MTPREHLESIYFKILELSWIRAKDIRMLRGFLYCDDAYVGQSIDALESIYVELLSIQKSALEAQKAAMDDFLVQMSGLNRDTDRLVRNAHEYAAENIEQSQEEDLLNKLN